MQIVRIVTGILVLSLGIAEFGRADATAERRPPNVIVIMADDLGAAELGCTGSEQIRTPNLDRLFANGMRFTNGYSGSTVCAPSRCTLLTGQHTGRSQIRGNGEIPNLTGDPGAEGTKEIGAWTSPPVPNGWWGGQRPLEAGTETIATALKRKGYATFAAGKWGLGGPMTEGLPTRQGFDEWIGYLCQRNAHNYYPTYLSQNEGKVVLEGNDRGLTGKQYATDLMVDAAVDFVEAHADEPFFLYYATPVPHLALQVPEDSLAEYRGKWDDPAYEGGRGYLAQKEPRATYAAMVTRMDRNIGRILDAVQAAGVAQDTIVFFTSDNGSTFDLGGYDPEFFNGTGGLRGHKCNLYEGGIRVPLAVAWPGRIEPGTSSDLPVANWDFFPTIMAMTDAKTNADVDGIDFSPELLGTGSTADRPYLYWEYHPGGGLQAVRMGRWKGVRTGINNNPGSLVQLYDLEEDPNETNNVAAKHPEVASRIHEIMLAEHTPSPVPNWNFPTKADDQGGDRKWTGEGETANFTDPGNWNVDEDRDLGFGKLQHRYVIEAGDAVVEATRLDCMPGGGIVLVNGRVSCGGQGVNGGTLDIRGGWFESQYLKGVKVEIGNDGALTLSGKANPLNRTKVDLSGNGSIFFLELKPEKVRKDHLRKITVEGAKAVEGENIRIEDTRGMHMDMGTMVTVGKGTLAPPPSTARLDLPGAPGFDLVKNEYERRNPGTEIDFMSKRRRLPVVDATCVVFLQKGEGQVRVKSAEGELSSSEFRVGDLLALRPGDLATFDAPVDAVVFTIEEPFDPVIPRIIRADFDPNLTDTPGGCATDPGAYRRLLLTWDPARGPYVHHGLNCHRVRIDDSFTHYHPVDGGWDEFYLVQDAPPGATLLTSRFTEQIEQAEIGGASPAVKAAEIDDLLQEHPLHNGSLVLLPRGLTHRGLGGAVVQVIAVPGFKPGFEIPMDRAIKRVNNRFALTGGRALPLHAAGADRPHPKSEPEEK
ncbi:MAG: arylsulfatase [Phycisphaerales bacterium]|nr:arylsulfatase [Phycisphaerales bacterium]